jgi:hypothetical protein
LTWPLDPRGSRVEEGLGGAGHAGAQPGSPERLHSVDRSRRRCGCERVREGHSCSGGASAIEPVSSSIRNARRAASAAAGKRRRLR